MTLGMNPRDVSSALVDPAYAEALDRNAALHEQYGCNGVPSFIVNNEYKLTGAQSADTWSRLFDLIEEENKAES